MMKKSFFELLSQLLLCTVGSAIYAAAVSLFLDPNGIVPGGFTGIAMILAEFLPLQTGTLTLILNIPLMIAGIFIFGARFLGTTIYTVAVSSLFMNLFAPIGALTDNLMLASLAGGAIMAVGLEIVLLQGATTGGTDIIVKMLRRKIRTISAGKFFLITDGLVVFCSAFVFKNIDAGLYAAICIVVSSYIVDAMLLGKDQAKLIIIISDRHREIASRLLEELDVGATYLDGQGAYSGNGKTVVLCVVRKWLIGKALKIVKAEDERSFAIVTTANEVFGEGYKPHDGEGI